MIYFIFGLLIAIGVSLSGISIYFLIKGERQNLIEAKELEAFTAKNGTSNKGESLDEIEVLTFYSPKALGLY